MSPIALFESGETDFVGFSSLLRREGTEWRHGVGWFFTWHNSCVFLTKRPAVGKMGTGGELGVRRHP